LFGISNRTKHWSHLWKDENSIVFKGIGRRLSSKFIINTLFASNIIGIVFARTLHYQFYCWYFYSVPLILWQSKLHPAIGLMVYIATEIAFNVFPATPWSSALLQIAHLILLVAIFASDIPEEDEKLEEKKERNKGDRKKVK
jgi:alpha-1,3-mannosyltransferase